MMFAVKACRIVIVLAVFYMYINYSEACHRRRRRRSSPPPCPGCHGLNGISYGSRSCSNGYSHGSRCVYSCSKGFTICSGKNYCFTCDCGSWRGGAINPQCCDVEEPTITCPRSITKEADPLQTSTVVEWSPPTVMDNSGNANVRLTTSKSSGSTFTEGSHTVCYEVSDPTGNKRSCCFTVTITVDRCDSPNEVEHQSVHCNDPDYKPGTTCWFSCDAGWCLHGNSQYSCNNQGYWSAQQPTCTPARCPMLIPPTNGYIVSSNTCSSSIGGSCAIACNDGYRLSNNNALRVCQIQVGSGCSGVWSGQDGDVVCNQVEAPTITCPSSITKKADPLRTSTVVEWSPPIVSGMGNVRLTTSKPSGSTFTEGSHMVCYEVSDQTGQKRSCCFTVTITVERCDSPDEVDHQTVNCNYLDYIPGTTCWFSCDAGWCLHGDSQWSCNNQGYWSAQQPTCTPVQCPILNPPTNGYIVSSNTCSSSIGGVCLVSCDDGYRLSNTNDHRVCQIQVGSGCSVEWSGQDGDFVCNRVVCPLLSVSSHASVTGCSATTEEVPSGTSCHWQCDTGYRGTGDGYESVCNDDGTWINGDFQCEEVTCISLQDRHPAYHTGCNPPPVDGKYAVGASCQWHCVSGFYGTGTNTSTCQHNGTWDMTNYDCIGVVCPLLSVSAHASITGCSATTEEVPSGTSCLWQCDTGYRGTGDGTEAVCKDDGTWRNRDFQCEDRHPAYHTGCNPLPVDGKYAVGASCQWHCVSGFYGTGTNTSTCQHNGTWDMTNYECIAVECAPLDVPQNGVLSCDTTGISRFCYINCQDGFDIPSKVSQDRDFEQPYVCRRGVWIADYMVPNCTSNRRPTKYLGHIELYYSSNVPCSDASTTQQIRESFIAVISESNYYGEYCPPGVTCGFDNVEVVCGIARKRRHSGSKINLEARKTTKNQKRLDILLRHQHTTRTEESKTKQVKRSSSFEFTISVDISRSFNPDPEFDMVDESWDAVDDLYNMMDVLYEMAENNQLVPDVDGMVMSCRLQNGNPANYWDEEVLPVCEPGYAEAAESVLCSPCFLGTCSVDSGCEGCPIGAYQDEEAKTECKPCPEGMSTLGTGSQDITDCKTICLPGQHSATGLAPCTSCPAGSYQPLGRSTQCVLCPDGQSTIQSGSQSQTDCIVVTDLCNPNTCANGGTCTVSGSSSFICNCAPDYTGLTCLDSADTICDPNPCNGGTCFQSEEGTDFLCFCPDGTVPPTNEACPDQTCSPLPKLLHGYWSCNLNEIVCNLRCNQGTDVRKGEPTVYTCSNGVWEPPFSSAAGCKPTIPSKDIKQTSDAKFTTSDNCTDVDMVREGVYTYLYSAFYGEEKCQNKCVVDDIDVSCEEGPQRDRRRRRKRQEPQIEYSMDICFTLKTDVNETATAVDIADDADALSFITQKISGEIQDGIFNAYVGGMSVQVVPVNGNPLDIGDIEQTCPDGYTEAATTLTCIACDEDTFEMNGECHPCSDDQYQPQKGQTSCIVPGT